MKNALPSAALCVALLLAAAFFAVAADEVPVPRMYKGMQKGQWKAQIQETSMAKSDKPMPTMNVCTDNLMQHSAQKGPEGCKRRLTKDTASEAVLESTCPERTSTVTMKKENDKNISVTIDSTGKRGPQHMKIHYTYLGACPAGGGTITFDKDSEQCKRMRASIQKMDPEKQKDQIARMKSACPG